MLRTNLFLLSVLFTDALRLQTSSQHTWSMGAPTENKPVFYCVIMGKLAYRHQVSLWLSSVRKLGGWKDEAVIVTDKPICLSKTLDEAKLLGAKISSGDDVDVYGPAEGYTGNIHIVKRPTAKSINKMKLEKARAWLNLKVAAIPHQVSSIIYTDEDVIVGKDLKEFMGLVRELEKAKHTLALFRDTGLSAGELHTGVVIIFPGKDTDECLQAWGKKLTGIEIGSSQPSLKVINEDAEIKEDTLLEEEMVAMGPDQQALGKTKPCKRSPDHDGIKILPGSFFWLPTPGGLKKDKKIEFVHFTNTGRWKRLGKTTIKAYLTRIGIPEEIDPTGHVSDKACSDADLPQTVE